MSRCLILPLLAYCVIGVFCCLTFGQDTLQKKLGELDKIRNEKTVPYDEVEKRGKELLAKFTTPEEQGQIYFHLTEIHGQTGMVHPDLTMQHAQSALALPVEPLQRLWLYVYWGDAIESANWHQPIEKQKPFFEERRAAVKPFLQGLKESQKYKIPDEMPSLPKGGNIIIDTDT